MRLCPKCGALNLRPAAQPECVECGKTLPRRAYVKQMPVGTDGCWRTPPSPDSDDVGGQSDDT